MVSADPHGTRITALVDARGLPAALAQVARARPLQVAVRPPSLEQLFLEQYSDEGGERP